MFEDLRGFQASVSHASHGWHLGTVGPRCTSSDGENTVDHSVDLSQGEASQRGSLLMSVQSRLAELVRHQFIEQYRAFRRDA